MSDDKKPDVPPVLWFCVSSTRSVFVLAHHPVSWANARAFAYRVLGTDLVTLDMEKAGDPDYELRFEGNDYNDPPDKRMQMRERGGEWVDA